MDSFDSQFDEFLKKSDSTCSSINSIDIAMLDSASSFKEFFKDEVNKQKFNTIEEEDSTSSKTVNKFLKSTKANASIKSESSKLNTNFGLDTLEEMKEKQQFFKKIEEDNSQSTVDYGKLNQQLNISDTLLIPLATTPIDTASFINTTYDEVEFKVDNENVINTNFELNDNGDNYIMNLKKNPKGILSQIGIDSLDNTFHQEPIRPKIKSILKEEMLLEINKDANDIHEINDHYIRDDENETNDNKLYDDNSNNEINDNSNASVDQNDGSNNNYESVNFESDDDNDDINEELKNEIKEDVKEIRLNANAKSQLSFTETSQDREALRSELQKVGKMESFSNTVLNLEESTIFDSLEPTNNKNEKLLKSKTISFEKHNNNVTEINKKQQLKSSYKQARFKDIKSSGYGPKSIRFKLSRSENFSSDCEKQNEDIFKTEINEKNMEHFEEKIINDKVDEEKYLENINILEQKYKNEINNLKQENFTLISKLEALKLKNTLKISEAPSSRIEELELQLQQEEYLRKGYEVENEKMYTENKRIKEDAKILEKSMFSENQKLKNELSNFREELTSKESQLLMYRSKIDTSNTAVMGGHRIAQLETALETSKENEDKLKLKYEMILNEKNIKEERLKTEIYNLNSELRINNEKQSANIEALKVTHNKELDALRKKLKFYVENQEILDRDSDLLKQKNAEITKMRCNIKELEGKLKMKNNEKYSNIKMNNPPKDNDKILDLKKTGKPNGANNKK